MFSQIVQIYAQVGKNLPAYFKILAIWFIIAVAGQMLSGQRDLTSQAIVYTPQSLLGMLITLSAVFLGWYSAHRFMITGEMPKMELGRPHIRFIGVEFFNIVIITIFSILLLIPVAILLGTVYSELPVEEIQRRSSQVALISPFIMIWVFGRFILAAPMLARGLPEINAVSWRLTKGHMMRLFVLQCVCFLPLLIFAMCSWLVRDIPLLATAISVMGTFSIVLFYTQLAEDEYKRLT